MGLVGFISFNITTVQKGNNYYCCIFLLEFDLVKKNKLNKSF